MESEPSCWSEHEPSVSGIHVGSHGDDDTGRVCPTRVKACSRHKPKSLMKRFAKSFNVFSISSCNFFGRDLRLNCSPFFV